MVGQKFVSIGHNAVDPINMWPVQFIFLVYKLKLFATFCDVSGFLKRLLQVFLYSHRCSLTDRRLRPWLSPIQKLWHGAPKDSCRPMA